MADGTLTVEPAAARLEHPLDRLQLIVTDHRNTSAPADRTREVRYDNLTPHILRVDAKGRVTPLGGGRGRVVLEHAGRKVAVAIEVASPNRAAPPSFREDAIPILSKAGCNQGACHASQFGQAGFKLSLLGFAPEQDHPALARDWLQRRVTPAAPDASLMLRKPTQQVPHGGGQRFEVGDYKYEVLRSWIAAGAPPPLEDEAGVIDLTVFPRERVYARGDQQQLRVVAHYSDGRTRDVTARALFDSLAEGIASVDHDGLVTVVGPGQAGIMVRYQGQGDVSHVLLPYGDRVELTDFQPANFIDERVKERWERLGLRPSGGCSDEQFIRRAFIDAVGTLPPPAHVERFLASNDPNKRAVLVDEVLGLTGDPDRDAYNEEWATYWALKWGDLLRVSRKTKSDAGMWAFHNWITDALRENRPMDQFVRDILTAQGSILEYGPANYFVSAARPSDFAGVAAAEDLAETTAQVFLGVRMQCARCHHHPFEEYSQKDYYSLAAFFTRLGSKTSDTFGRLGFDAVLTLNDTGSIQHPRTGEVMQPTPLGGQPLKSSDIEDLREPLVDWMLSAKNPLFARNIANRVWGYFMGTALIEPIDDVRATNPPSNPQLLEELAHYFIESGYDLRQLMRAVMNSRVYQLSSTPRAENVDETRFYAHYNVKRLSAEVLLDAIDYACGTQEKFPDVPLGIRAIALPDSQFESYFLDTLGRPRRLINCECERTSEPNLAQVLHIANGEVLHRKLTDKKGRLTQLVEKTTDNRAAVRALYLVTFSRPPSSEESERCVKIMERSKNRREGLENVLWALCNSREFLFNH